MAKEKVENTENKFAPYTLVNSEKLNRAVNGMIGANGQLVGGVGENASVEVILAEYDRLGGCVMKGENKVKMGSFYDFAGKKARTEPEIVFEFRVNGEKVEIAEGEEVPLAVKAEKIANEVKAKKGKGKKKTVEDEVEE